MSLSVTIDGVEYAGDHVRLRWNGQEGVQGLSSAADGTGAQGAITLDDPEGNIEIRSWMPVVVEESACSQPRLFTGYVASYVEKRGRYTDGPGREIDITLNDVNVLLSLRIGTDNSQDDRPAETDTARLAALLDSAILDGIVFDTGFVNGFGRGFDATNWQGKTASEILSEIAGPREQIYFAFWDPTEDKVGLFFDAADAVTFSSILSFSNVPGEYDDPSDTAGSVYPPRYDAQREATGENVYGNLRYVGKGVVYYVSNPTTQATYFPSPLLTRGINIENDTVGRPATAKRFGDRLINGPYAQERSTVSFSSILHAVQIGHILAGQRVQIHFQHLSGLQDDFVWTRVETLTVAPVEGSVEFYEAFLTCSTAGLSTTPGVGPGGGGTGGGSTQPFPPTQHGGHWWSGSFAVLGDHVSTGDPDPALTDSDNPSPDFEPDTTYTYHVTIQHGCEVTGSYATALGIAPDGNAGAPFYAHNFGNPVPGLSDGLNTLDGTFTTSDASHYGGPTQYFWGGAADCDHSATHSSQITYWVDPDGWDATAETPASGTPIDQEFVANGDGSTTAFTTEFPYAPESLRVFVDGVPIVNGLSEVDPAARTFSLDFAPLAASGDTAAEKVTVAYVVA